jgi:hypothetical protein
LAASSSENVMPWLRTSSKSFCALSPNRDDACACATGGDAGVGPGIGCPFAFATGGALGAAAVAGAASSRASGRRNASAITSPMTRTASAPINPSVRTRMRATRSPSRAYTGRWFFSGSRYAPLFVSLTSLSPPFYGLNISADSPRDSSWTSCWTHAIPAIPATMPRPRP